MIYLSIDPGETTGFAIFNEDGNINWFSSFSYATIPQWLETLHAPDVVAIIMEEYRLNPVGYKRQTPVHSKMITVQVIGMVKSWAIRNKVKLIEQPRNCKEVGYKYWGKKPLPKSDPLNHVYDAIAHGIYWLVQNNIIKVKI